MTKSATGVLTVYLDGVLNDIAATDYWATALGSVRRVGASPTTFHDGKIDEVRLFDRVLSVAEIVTLYHGGTVLESGLVADPPTRLATGVVTSTPNSKGTVVLKTQILGSLQYWVNGCSDPVIFVSSRSESRLNSRSSVEPIISPAEIHRQIPDPVAAADGGRTVPPQASSRAEL